jgi:hypothetical protein
MQRAGTSGALFYFRHDFLRRRRAWKLAIACNSRYNACLAAQGLGD